MHAQVAPGKAEDPRAAHRHGKHGSTNKLGSTHRLGSTAKLGSMAQLASAFSAHPTTPAAAGVGGHEKDSEAYWQKTLSLRNTSIALEDILHVRTAPVYVKHSCAS